VKSTFVSSSTSERAGPGATDLLETTGFYLKVWAMKNCHR